jgi:hypothetical protein
MRTGGIWNLVKQSDDQEARNTAIEEACNCPSGRLVIKDNVSGKVIEPEFEKSIVVIEYPPRGEHGPLWVSGDIPIESANGKPYEIRNRVTLCRCDRRTNRFVTEAILRDKFDMRKNDHISSNGKWVFIPSWSFN